ncbi:MAG: replicative DNA helicase [Planctomycetes bacterium]|nr:replicative DNA helicase [Planctomycetota bacterium]
MSDARNLERIAPHDVDAEAALLGAVLLDGDTLHEIGDKIVPDDFYVSAHRHVYAAMLALDKTGSTIDAITVKDELKRQKALDAIGGPEALVRLAESVPSSAAAKHHARIVRDTARLRALLRAGQEIVKDAYEPKGDVASIVDQAEQRIFAVRGDDTSDLASIAQLMKLEVQEIERREALGGKVTPGLSTGFSDLNAKLGGLRNGELIIVAARPSMGKTTFALNMATHIAVKEKKGVLVFSLEVGKLQVAENLLCSLARMNAMKIRQGEIQPGDWPMIIEAANALSESPVYVDDTPAISLLALRAKARRLKARDPRIGLIVVDYLQLMTSPGAESRQHEISQISQGLKALARELDLPVISLSQLNRAVDARDDHRPRMSDLRESGSIEQDADVVMFLYRDAYYKAQEDLLPQQLRTAEVIIGKHRNGPTGVVSLYFFGERLRFEDPARAG